MQTPLVLLPGFMTDLRIWGPQIEALASDTTLVLPPLGPFDRVEDMATHLLTQLPPRFALAGHSLGGHVAMEILRRAPDRVARIAFVAAGCLPEPPHQAAERELRLVRAKAGQLAAVMAEDVPAATLADGPLRAPLADFLADGAEALGVATYERQVRALQRRPDQQKTLRQAHLPALILGGSEDRLMPRQRCDFVAGLMPRGVARTIAGAGHLPMLERPDDVIGALREWMGWSEVAVMLR
ncbi:Pimeloyl-ACP methyl ester carboxylesterase [Palleronia salina]|uniref:Pimeloyl-ACP methyl ester carboxylesterase n=1 Tax=Palleronia salina TaxID=313368 RepID=A0A1M6G344_9RHOB|nr:alpha/beta fold hydrolase [Palleronia salina]SHJ04381.1 Pimeloyl-ACP methyl ester carboxylesterase [Palleronia salina]